ncbi:MULTISPECIES: single-stranded DNA-binding protein [Pseudothermotoga]|jgi:single-strand DNA-binding protein|uniref:Single-stranded DNA-binding protein n=1 Tax=Pseudothermotoga lettingae (strain ATCC BAA-301 / DSM 14385 / NBRC 107922 / TMO) TaxID=416591 RepID=A8F5G1_PSELT|nr:MULTISPECIES: single-stranded DNA-binding protein [Pseudothermotoga]ABV33395.1 single-strand binding protein [Pseudothermotoga lettingae TMO]KUK20811.1 MAG: Single-stranded DNA-binding protein [Pseudothermotoga lettingae]MDK2884435.1 single-strand DNA-binding protein [Pseudothermotoga sp.]GLI49691.1 single-stranded DNA-binding protein [Pseudothermotoga lettingae TMO]HBT25548.1 single-stranded DNA-binding protein [Pseudothermotoga sp.]
MPYFNKVILVGRITRDPEIRFTTSGKGVASFSLAVDRPTRANASSDQQTTDFIRIVAFNKLADFAKLYLKKGLLILVEGELRLQRWQARDGTNRTTAEIWARDIRFLEKKTTESESDSFVREEPVEEIPDESEIEEHDPDEPPF